MWFKEYVEAISGVMGNVTSNYYKYRRMENHAIKSVIIKRICFNLKIQFDGNEYNWWGLFLGY